MNVRGSGPACESRFAAKSSPIDACGVWRALATLLDWEYEHTERCRWMSPDQGIPGDGSNDARKIDAFTVGGAFGSVAAATLVTTGEYAGVARVVVFFAMSAKIAPMAFCRSPGVSAK